MSDKGGPGKDLNYRNSRYASVSFVKSSEKTYFIMIIIMSPQLLKNYRSSKIWWVEQPAKVVRI